MPAHPVPNHVAPDRPLAWMRLTVDIGFAVLLIVCATQYFSYHPLADDGVPVLLLALGSGAAYAVAAIGPPHPVRRSVGVLVATGLWLPLAVIAPSFGWCAFALFFAVHRVLRRGLATIASGAIVVAVSTGLFLMSNGEDLGLVLGPFFGGLVLSFAYDALDRALENRRRLIEELVDAREQLARSEREAGALAERNRVAGELHDTVVQRTASALLLLESDEEATGRTPAAVAEAREVLREALAETRRLLHGLSRPRSDHRSLADALGELTERHGATLSVIGDEHDPGDEVDHALLRVAQEALVNAGKHARASSVRVTLTFFEDAVGIDVADDGVGFAPADLSADAGGYGLRAMAWRVENLGGSFSLESAPGQGTVIAGVVPAAPSTPPGSSPLSAPSASSPPSPGGAE
ncbi:sensor histidine kinase [Leucobacter celer]|uniref:sensor histidine kinase n=1 Tax=Leucobacter celer TaxID=668625 RepID=UPI0006A7B229|nr:sensor histidine kinase [Leucobacter celer]